MSAGLFSGVRKEVLENGLTVLVNEDRSTDVVALEVFVNVGSNHETDAVWGWSHGIEHMLFKGTERRGLGDVAREVSELGGRLNAGTWYERTSYFITVPREGFARALDIHADVLANSAFEEGALEDERGVLVEELNMYRDVPDGTGFTLDELMAVAFTKHRYRRSVIGTIESLQQTPRSAIVDFYRGGYVPSNMVYVVTGDIDADEAVEAVRSALGTLPGRRVSLAVPEAEPPQREFRSVALTGGVERAYFKIAFHVPGERHADTPALRVLAHLLGSGRSCRFHRRIVERRALASSVDFIEITGRDPGVLIVDGATEPERLEDALAAVYAEIFRCHDELVSPTELEKALNNVVAAFVSILETVEGQASILGHFETLGDYALVDDYAAEIARVTPEDVRRVAREYLTFDGSTVLTYVPGERRAPDRSGAEALAGRLRERIAAEVARRDGAPQASAAAGTRPEVPSITPSRSGAEGEIQERTLPGGAPLLVRSRPKLPTAALAVYGRSGLRFETPDKVGVGTLGARCLLKGAGSRSDEALAEEIERHAITLHPFSDRDTAGFYVECLTSQLPRALDLFADIICEPAFGERAVARERELLLSDIRQEQDDTASITLDAFRRRLFGDHPYGWNVMGTEETVARISREDLLDWHRRFFVLGNLSFAAVGDLDAAWLERELAARLQMLPEGPVPRPPARDVVFPTSFQRETLRRDKEQSVIVLGMPAPALGAESRFPLIVLDHILSDMSGRLFSELRNKRHLCYHTQSFYSPLEDAGVFGGFVATGPDRTEEAVDALHAELDRARREAPSQEELDRSVAAIVGNRLISMQRNGRQAMMLARRQLLGDYREVFRFPDRIRALTREDVLKTSVETIALERAVLTVLTAPTAKLTSPA